MQNTYKGMKFYNFTLRVKHDDGFVTFRTVATGEREARRAVMLAERCPERSIRRVYKGKEV